MSLGYNKLKYLIDNGYKEITPTLVGAVKPSLEHFFYFNYTIKQSFTFYKLIIDCKLFYNDVIKMLSVYYEKLPEDYNKSNYNISIHLFIPLLKENKNNFTIYLKNVEIFKNQGFNHCNISINEYRFNVFFNNNDNPENNPEFKNFRFDTIEKIINYTSCVPSKQYTLSSQRILEDGEKVDDNFYSNFSEDYTNAEIIDEKIKNSKFKDNNTSLFYYLLNYYYLHEKKKSISQKEFLDMYSKNTLIFKK